MLLAVPHESTSTHVKLRHCPTVYYVYMYVYVTVIMCAPVPLCLLPGCVPPRPPVDGDRRGGSLLVQLVLGIEGRDDVQL